MFSRRGRSRKYYKRNRYIPRNYFRTNSYSTKIIRKPASDIIKYPINNQSLEQFSSYIQANISYFPYLQRISEIVTDSQYNITNDNVEVEIDFFNPENNISIFHNYPQFENAIVVLESVEWYCEDNPTIPVSYARYSPFIGQNLSTEDFSTPGYKFCLETTLEQDRYNVIPVEARPNVSLNIAGDTVNLKIVDNHYEFDSSDEYNIHTYYASGIDPANWPSVNIFKRIFPFSFISRNVTQYSVYNKDEIPGYLHELYIYLSKQKNLYSQFEDPEHPHFYVPLGIKVNSHPELEMRYIMTVNDQSFYTTFQNQKMYYELMNAFPAYFYIKAHWSVYLTPDLKMNADNSFFIRNAP